MIAFPDCVTTSSSPTQAQPHTVTIQRLGTTPFMTQALR